MLTRRLEAPSTRFLRPDRPAPAWGALLAAELRRAEERANALAHLVDRTAQRDSAPAAAEIEAMEERLTYLEHKLRTLGLAEDGREAREELAAKTEAVERLRREIELADQQATELATLETLVAVLRRLQAGTPVDRVDEQGLRAERDFLSRFWPHCRQRLTLAGPLEAAGVQAELRAARERLTEVEQALAGRDHDRLVPAAAAAWAELQRAQDAFRGRLAELQAEALEINRLELHAVLQTERLRTAATHAGRQPPSMRAGYRPPQDFASRLALEAREIKSGGTTK